LSVSIDNNHTKPIKNKMKQTTENKIQILKNAIQEGINSGIAKDFNAEKYLQILKIRMKSNG
jgi:antitoxin ParD1/3/4